MNNLRRFNFIKKQKSGIKYDKNDKKFLRQSSVTICEPNTEQQCLLKECMISEPKIIFLI